MPYEMQKLKTIDQFDKNEQSLIRKAVREAISLLRAEEKRGTTYEFNQKSGRLTLGKIVNLHAYRPIELARQALFGPLERMNMTVQNFGLYFEDMAMAVEHETARQMGYIPSEP